MTLVTYLKELDGQYSKSAHVAYWAMNPRKWKDNEYESYGLVKDDWNEIKWDYRLADILSLATKGDIA